MGEQCSDNRFEIIEVAKKHILEATNIDTSPDEMKVLDSFLYRCWQMGWLDEYKYKLNFKAGHKAGYKKGYDDAINRIIEMIKPSNEVSENG
jgi:hypothetical protein